MKKSIYFGLMAVVMLSMLGCGQPKKSAHEIELWHWMTDREEALTTLAKKYEEQTGIKIKFSLFAPSDAYSQKIMAAAQANVLPDIYGILDKKSVVASFIKAGYVADLTPDFEVNEGTWEKIFYPKAIDNNRFLPGNTDEVSPGIYAVPMDVANIQMIYNRKLLKRAGILKPPATFEAFLDAVEALKRIGVAPFVTGFGEMWLVDCFASNYAFNIMGEAKVMATFKGEVPYTDPDWIAVFNVFKTLAVRGAFMEGIVTKGNKYAEQDFALERAAFSFDGSWCVNIYMTMNEKLDYGVMPLPAINLQNPMKVWGGAGSSFVVNERSPRKGQAIAFLKWITAREQQLYFAQKTHNLPSNRAAGSVVPRLLADFSKAMDNSTHPTVWSHNEHPLVIEAFDKGIQAIIIGEKSPHTVALEVQKVKQRILGKKKY